MPPPALILDRVFDHEIERRAQLLLTQPVGGGGVIDIPWGEAVDQARRMAAILARIPMARFLAADEVAAQVAWLCSADCTFATGAVFDLSGGRATY